MLCRIPRCHSPGDDDILGHSQNVWLDKQQECRKSVVAAVECGIFGDPTSDRMITDCLMRIIEYLRENHYI